MYNSFVGIDISKDSFDCAIISSDSKLLDQSKFAMNSNGFASLLSKLKQTKKVGNPVVLMESTGIYHRNLLSFLLKNQVSAAVINPMHIHNFTKSFTLRKTKTDAKDAFVIANYCLKHTSEIHVIEAEINEDLKLLHREREYVTKEISKEKTKMKNALSLLFPELEAKHNVFTFSMLKLLASFPSANKIAKAGEKNISALLQAESKNKSRVNTRNVLDLANSSIGTGNSNQEFILVKIIDRLLSLMKQQDDFDKKINSLLDEETNNQINILTTIGGIGQIEARNFLIEIGDIRNFSSANKVKAFSGTDPAVKQSGKITNSGGRISKRGSPFLRRTLWQMAKNGAFYEIRFKEYYKKKRLEGKSYKQAIIAVVNKLIVLMYAMLKNKTAYYDQMAMSMN